MNVHPLKVKKVCCDADIWAYRIGYSCQHEADQEPQPWFTVKWAIHETIEKVQRQFPNATLYFCLTEEHNNYRTEIAVTRKYKGGRVSQKPYWWRKIRDWLMSQPTAIVSVNEEADDVMSKMLIADPKKTAICTEDKDLQNTPGLHFNDKTGTLTTVNKDQAYHHFYTQLLTGDTVDNIAGCPLIGKIKAVKILDGCKSPEEYERAIGFTYACSKKVLDPEATMVEMGRLLWMRRVNDELWDLRANGFTTKE